MPSQFRGPEGSMNQTVFNSDTYFSLLRTEVKGDFNIDKTKYV